jgi:four helix bundle protein
MGEELEKYQREDGSIDWGRYAADQLRIIDNLSLINKKKKTKPLEELSVFKLADELSDKIWKIVNKWNWFSKKTVGDQIVRACDSIGANIAEGYGRYFFGEYLVFLYYARGSVYETKFWLEKARKRSLISDLLYKELKRDLEKLPMEINKVIKIVKKEKERWKEKRYYYH